MSETTKMVAVIALSVVIISLSGIFKTESSNRSDIDFVKDSVATEFENGKLEANYKEGFIEGCSEEGTTTPEQCSCVYEDIIAKKGGFDELLDISIRAMQGKEMTDKQAGLLMDGVYECL